MPAIDFAIRVHGKKYLTYTENQVRVHVFLAMCLNGAGPADYMGISTLYALTCT